MRMLLRFLFGLFVIAGVVAAAMRLSGNYEIIDRLTQLFWITRRWLPVTFSFEQFLIIFCLASVLLLVVIVTGWVITLIFMGSRRAVATHTQSSQLAAAKAEIGHVKEQFQRQYEQLLLLGQTLTRRLDQRVLVQALLEAASRLTSSPSANSVASCWLFRSETDTFRFEMGLYCDETLFTKAEFNLAEPPFAHILSTQQPWLVPAWRKEAPFVKPEKAERLGSATGLIVVPCVIEGQVLAVLALFCHPDILEGYAEQRAFYNAVWNELTLATIIAIQGAVTILDRLTGVHTREYFMTRLTQEIARANRYQLPISLLMIDIDNFKLVNDMLGHPPGDAALRIIAKLIRKEVRAIDLVGRYGGEEFVVLLPETGSGDENAAAGALVVAERMRKSVDDEFHELQKPLNLTISIGVAVRRFPQDREMDYREFVRSADEQLYRAKTSGKNKVCYALREKPQPVV